MKTPLRIALLSPKGPLYRHRGGIYPRNLRYMPLTLPTLAALVPADLNAEVRCIDEGIQDIPHDLDADLIGLTAITGTAPRAYELARRFRSQGKSVVLGGPHVTLAPDDAQPHADSIVVGYAEEEWPRLLRDFVRGKLKKRYTQASNLVLTGRPLPDRSVLPRWKYLTLHVFEATRACVHGCEFCVVPSAWGRRPMHTPINAVVEDLRRMRTRRAIFLDLNIIADQSYAEALFRALIPLRIQWFGLATTRICDRPALLDLAARSGCRGLLIGLESIRSANLRSLRKGFNHPENYHQVVSRLHEHGIAIQGCFVFGLDDDTPDIFMETARFAVDAGIDLPRFAVATPFPGTPLYARLEREQRITSRNWELYDGQHVVFRPLKMTIQELEDGTRQAWEFAYSWPNIVRRLRHTVAPLPVAVSANLGYRHYAFNLDRFYTCDWILQGGGAP